MEKAPEAQEGEQELRQALDQARRTQRLYEQALDRLEKVETALDTQKAFSDQLLATMQAVVVVLDEQGRIVYINPFMERLSGYRLAEVMEKDWFETFLPARDRQGLWVPFARASSGVQTEDNINAIVTKSGEERLIRWFDHRLPAWAGNEHWRLASGIDVTEVGRWERYPAETICQGLEDAICRAVEARDPYAAGHQRRVAALAVAIGRKMRLAEEVLQGLHMGAIILDIGKLQVPAQILTKPARLDAAEYALVKQHSDAGYSMLKDIRFPWPVAEIAYQHHERLDGSGYPQGLKGDEICLEARIVAVADVVEAMRSHRPYRGGLGVEAALAEIAEHRGTRYDADVVDACLGVFADGFHFG